MTHLYRNPKIEKKHQIELKKYEKKGICPFCVSGLKDQSIKKEGGCFLVIWNKYPYQLYKGREVEKHLLIIPRDHVESIKKLEKDKYDSIVAEWKAKKPDATIYREQGDPEKSVPHAHIHLIYYK